MEEFVDEEPIPQRLRVMTVLDIAPGHAKDPDNGPPIGILSLEHKGEIEQPILFFMDDVKRLAVGFLSVMAFHDDAVAKEIMRQHFPNHEV
jgi:hypothetical protein